MLCVTLLANQEGLDLTQLARRIAGAHNPRLGPPALARAMRVQESPFTPEETRVRVRNALSEAGLTLEPLIDDPREIVLALPEARVRVRVWEEGGSVWVVADDPREHTAQQKIDAVLLRAVSGD